MIIHLNDEPSAETNLRLFNDSIKQLIKTDILFLTGKPEIYDKWEGSKILANIVFSEGMQKRSTGIAMIDTATIVQNVTALLSLGRFITAGIIFTHVEVWFMIDFFQKLDQYKQGLVLLDKHQEQKEKIKEEYEAKKEAYKTHKKKLKQKYEDSLVIWKERCSEIKEENKKNKKEFEEVLTKMDESQRKFMKEPEPIELPVKPEEPDYGPKPEEPIIPTAPAAKSYKDYGLDTSTAWTLLRDFEWIRVDGTPFGLLRKRKVTLQITRENVTSISRMSISKEEFETFIKENDYNAPSFSKFEQPISGSEKTNILKIISKNDKTLASLKYDEEVQAEIKILPCLTDIKPQHAASMLAGGLGNYEHEVKVEGKDCIIKAAMVSKSEERKLLVNNQEVTEIISSIDQSIGVYYPDTYELKIYN